MQTVPVKEGKSRVWKRYTSVSYTHLDVYKRQGYDYIKSEFTYGKSRIDFYMEKGEQKYLMEVKGCKLEVGGIGYFPVSYTHLTIPAQLTFPESTGSLSAL